MPKSSWPLLASLLILLTTPMTSVAALMGITQNSILFGQSACFSGPNKKLGESYQVGILAAFEEQNRKGGVGRRTLKLVSLDDAYEPERAAANVQKFSSDNDVFAVIGGVGTPTAKRITPILKNAKIPFVGPFTGASFLRDHKRFPNIINLRGSYFDETKNLVDYIVGRLGKKRLGIIYQGDAFGRSVLRNYKTILEDLGLPILAKTTYSRNTHAVHSGLFAAAKADLDAILIVGSYAANATIINLAHSLGHEYIMANLSFVLSYELKKRVRKPSSKILVTEVMPDARDTSRMVVRKFQQALKANFKQSDEESAPIPNEVSLEGYILGRYVIAVLERMGDKLTRENFLTMGLSEQPFAIDDWILKFNPGSNAGSQYIRLTHLGDDVPMAKGND